MCAPILGLDDNPLDLELLRRAHEEAGLSAPLITFLRPLALISHLENAALGSAPEPRTIILDIRMPIMSGFEVAEILHEIRSDLPPIVFFTSSCHPDDLRRAERLGTKLVLKPMDLDGYIAFLRSLCAESHAQPLTDQL